MASCSTLVLVRKAREGDGEAREALIHRFYQDWVDQFHGELGKTIRKLYDTADLVQSAVTDALRDLPKLKNDAVFFIWVTSIIRHKIAARKRRLAREVPLHTPGGNSGEILSPPSGRGEDKDDIYETYIETLDVILDLFKVYPEEMAVVVLKLFEERPTRSIMDFLDASERTVYRRFQEGMALLRARLQP